MLSMWRIFVTKKQITPYFVKVVTKYKYKYD